MARSPSAIRVFEYGHLHRKDVGTRVWDRLRTFDEAQARQTRTPTILDWRFACYAVAGSRVGVVRVPGLTLEILPKICRADAEGSENLARGNLLHMLRVARALPVSVRGRADLATERMPLLDAVASSFAHALLEEFTRGPDRGYVRRSENLRHVRGRIELAEHMRRNAVLQHRVFVAFDEFQADTWLNQTFKAAARVLFRACASSAPRSALGRVLDELSDVATIAPHAADQRRVQFHRHNLRYEPLFRFACQVLAGRSPAPRSGELDAFSIVFPMEKLFEVFVARFLRSNAEALGLQRSAIHVQARGRPKYLLRRLPGNQRCFRLQPDLLVDPHGDFRGLVLDTKWKLLADPETGAARGPSNADLYQVAAYAQRFGMPDNVLLYPGTAGAAEASYVVEGNAARIHVRTLPLDHDLRRDRRTTVRAMRGVLGIPDASPITSPRPQHAALLDV